MSNNGPRIIQPGAGLSELELVAKFAAELANGLAARMAPMEAIATVRVALRIMEASVPPDLVRAGRDMADCIDVKATVPL